MITIQRNTTLSAHIVAFSRFLRKNGYITSPNQESDALVGLSNLEPSQQNFFLTLRSVFPQNFKNLRDFDALYAQYWKELEKGVDSKIKEQEEKSDTKKRKPNKKNQEASFESLKNWLYGNKKQEEEELAAFGHDSILEKKDFSSFTDDDLAESEKLIKQIARRLALKPSRRYKPTKRNGVLDLRRTLQKNFRHGEELLFLYQKKRKPTQIKLILLCDVSKSMEIYSRFFVQFMYAFRRVYRRIETYVFSTSLHNISQELDETDFRTALNKLSENFYEWAGGTNIGNCFKEFSEKDALRMVDKKTIIMIVSDGLDMGESEVLEESLKVLKKRANKIIWLNPLAGNENYRPEAQAMKTAMPLIDVFASGHNLSSLKEVVLKM